MDLGKAAGIRGCLGRVGGLAAAAAVVLAWGVKVAAGAGESSPAAYDLTVFVVARPPIPTQVALSYSQVVDEKRLRESIEELAERAGAQVSEVDVEQSPLERGSEELATGAQFQARGLIKWETGALPVGAIVRALPEWRHMRVVFLVGENFRFAGPRDGAADGLVVRLVNAMEAYEYDVERMSGRVGPSVEVSSPGPGSAPVMPAVLIAVVPGLVLGWLLAERRGKEMRRGS